LSSNKINFEDMQSVYKNPDVYLLINTLSETEQECLILGTVTAQQEEAVINRHLANGRSIRIVIYGRNCNDDKVGTKYYQLRKLGFGTVYVYGGGLFEWMMLQDIYGAEEFPTTAKQVDILKFKPRQLLRLGITY
jgi:hypothetical protein